MRRFDQLVIIAKDWASARHECGNLVIGTRVPSLEYFKSLGTGWLLNGDYPYGASASRTITLSVPESDLTQISGQLRMDLINDSPYSMKSFVQAQAYCVRSDSVILSSLSANRVNVHGYGRTGCTHPS